VGVGFECANYTKYDILCHMVPNVTMVTFWMALLVNESTNIVIDNGSFHPLFKALHSLVSDVMKYCHG
jgi:hypothetical protein